MKHPVLYHAGKNGEIWQWTVWVEGPLIFSEHGIVGGKMQVASKRAVGKNTGKKNATTDNQQAELEAAAMFKFKLDRKYSLTPAGAEKSSYFPMLAYEWAKKKNKVVYPCHAQPKLDGCRSTAMWEGDAVVLRSRNGKVYHMPHIVNELQSFMGKDDVLDGELYRHDTSHQSLMSWIKRWQRDSLQVQYHIYDVPEWHGADDLTWRERAQHLLSLKKYQSPWIQIVDTVEVASEADVEKTLRFYEDKKFEGIMLRNLDGLYEYDHRSNNLLKVKSFQDAEFKIIGFRHGDGKFENVCIWNCEVGPNETFEATAAGNQEEKEQQFKDAVQYLGQMLKVKFQKYSDKGVPIFPVAIGFRLPEDV